MVIKVDNDHCGKGVTCSNIILLARKHVVIVASSLVGTRPHCRWWKTHRNGRRVCSSTQNVRVDPITGRSTIITIIIMIKHVSIVHWVG